WLTDVLLVKLCRWAEEKSLRIGQTSLKLVAVDEYNKLYNELKQKYGVKLVEVWPERTDPQKFVYEDIAIATYLLLLWRSDCDESGEIKKQSFVDLGCGNGLLVYILTAEGHKGVGLDLRKRQIWDWYGSGVNLKIESITPSSDTLFPEYDWLIGNHSDELTPWIPVMAARSSYKCKYFVLPCCHFDFNCKFNQRDTGTSQYQTYLNFVQQVGEVCGFNVEEDTLRIPSTKRVCFVGRSRNYKESEESVVDTKRMEYINNRCIIATDKNSIEGSTGIDSNAQSPTESDSKKIRLDEQSCENGATPWAQSFQPRSAKEIPRNCQSVPSDIKTMIVKTVFQCLIESTDSMVIQTEHGTSWNKGGTLPLSNVAELFTSETLQKLKCECGGLQTLLRNHNHIFQVTGGIVRLRDLSSDDLFGKKNSKKKKVSKTNSEDFIKTTLCWFNEHHPDGCPQLAVNCKYAHGAQELRQKPLQSKS
ncbi:hypothetical protein LOTGIDRAFT_115011, partial [Lottia gigantea]